MSENKQISFSLDWENQVNQKLKIIKDVIIDRKSKYTVVVWYIESRDQVNELMREILIDKYFQKSSHNSYAYRIKQENWSILDWKNDDWEKWAWMCILREIQRENYVNIVVVVTRYFWWVHLNADRFKNVIDACKIFFEKEKSL